MLCEDGERRYEWQPIVLTPDEHRFLTPLDTQEQDEVYRQKIALSKCDYNDLTDRIRDVFDRMRAAQYPLPHTVNVRSRTLHEQTNAILDVMRDVDKRSGLATIWLEEWPLYSDYFRLCFERDSVLMKINSCEKKLGKHLRMEAKKAQPKTRAKA